MIKDPKLVPIAKNYQNFLAHREMHLKMVSTGVESITIWGEALSCKCAASMQEELVAKGLASALLVHVLAPIKVVISFAAQQKTLERSNR
jgi:hypothetical protein